MRLMVMAGMVSLAALVADGFGAATIVQPTAATDSGHFNSSTTADRTRDGSRFSDADKATISNGQPVPMTWPSASGGFDGNYVNAASTSNTITYTLSATPVDIAGLHYWPYNGDGTGRDLQSFDISFSADGMTYSPVQSFTGLPKLSDDNVATAGIDLTLSSAATGVEFAKITNMVNYGTPDCCGSFDGIEEVRFVTTVPEPAMLSSVALASLGLLARRRKSC